MPLHILRFVLLAAALALPLPAIALPPPPDVPDQLKPWQAWTLHTEPDLLCASWGDGRVCDWPGHLTVKIDEKSGSFALDVWMDQPDVIELPGDAQAWPQNLQVDDVVAVVLAESAHPSLRLAAGHHKITGNFAWTDAPELLALPKEIGVVELTLRGAKVEVPRRDDQGRLLLQKEGGGAGVQTDSLSIAVARKLDDGVPLHMTTRLVLRVGGKARDAVLGQVLPAGWRPIAVTCPLPTQVGSDGAVRLHVRPGQHQLDIEAVLADNAAQLVVPALAGEGFEHPETWVWQPDEAIRSVEVSGLAPVDPERTQLDAEWKKGRTYLGEPGQILVLKQTRRGETESPPNALVINRQMWLDLDGQGLTSRDQITGQVHQGWRLATAPGWQVGRAAVGGRDQLITLSQTATPVAGDNGPSGVELRSGNLNLEADARHKQISGGLRAVGWATDVQTLHATLHLPPGWTLMGAKGVDELPATWTDSWTLLDFFFVLMVALSFAKLLGKRWAVVTVLALVACHGESDAPYGIWLAVLAPLGLLAVLPPSKFRKFVSVLYGVVLIGLVLQVVPFAARQIRHGVYPQIGQDERGQMALGDDRMDFGMAKEAAPAATVVPAAPPAEPVAQDAAQAMGGENGNAVNAAPDKNAEMRQQVQTKQFKKSGKSLGWSSSGSGEYLLRAADDSKQLNQIDAHAVVQTGPGVPTWSWTTWPLTWNGPVRADHEMQLYLMSPLANLGLAILRALLVLLLTLRLVDLGRIRKLMGSLQVAAPVALMLVLMVPAMGHAAEPPPNNELLTQLHDRLVAAQQCEGPCLVVSQLTLKVDGQRATLTADVSAQRPVGWIVPGPLDALQLELVTIDGQPTRDLRRDDQSLVRVRVPAGHHVVTVTGMLARRSVVDLQLGSDALPKRVVFDAKMWTIDGLDPNGAPQQSLQLTRHEVALPGAATPGEVAMAAATTSSDVAAELPPWFTIERHLVLGLPWTVRTVIHRNNAERPGMVKLPLLPGEVVLTDGVRIEEVAGGGRRALVSFARGESAATFDGQLPLPEGSNATVQLTAPKDEPWTETWRMDCSPIWQCSWQGVPPSFTRDPNDAALRPVWQPWPGEAVTLQIVRPAGAPGQSVTIDDVKYTGEPGQRLLAAKLELHFRTSQGGSQKVTLPQGAELQSVTIDGAAKTLRPKAGVLVVPLNPGAQTVVIAWQQPWDRQFAESLPAVDLGGPAANVKLSLKVGDSRWLLWAHGPKWGAAVLFWSRLFLVLLLALALARVPGPPLKWHHWLLLGLGMAQLPTALTLVVIGWFLAMAWRRRYGIAGIDGNGALYGPAVHNVMQLGLFGWGLFALGTLYGAIHTGLLLDIDMQVAGANSTGSMLNWVVDRTSGPLPSAGMMSLPLWIWRGAMLLWALWLVAALLRWMPWAWQSLIAGKGWLPWVSAARPVRPAGPPPAGKAPVGQTANGDSKQQAATANSEQQTATSGSGQSEPPKGPSSE